MELHHIKQAADGGDNSADNCIPLCLDCHAEVRSYNPHHPKGRKFTETELKGHRDKCYALHSLIPASNTNTTEEKGNIFFPAPKKEEAISSWGYMTHDKLCPLQPGTLILVAGYTETKKSMYVQHTVNHNLRGDQRVVYCCLKDHPLDVTYSLIAEDALLKYQNLKFGSLTERDWEKIALSQAGIKGQNLVLLPYNELTDTKRVLSIVETSGAEIVVIDDFNGLVFEDESKTERFMYQLKNAASMSGTIVFVIYNLSFPRKRFDMRPTTEDLPENIHYRLFDTVQFMFRPAMHNLDDDGGEDALEVIMVKGGIQCPHTFKMRALNSFSGVVACEE